MPANARQTAQFPFANNCNSFQVFEVSADPPAPWLRFRPATANLNPGASFDVEVLADSSGRAVGAYRTSLKVICASCAASKRPCFQPAHDFPVEMTVAHANAVGQFEAIPDLPDQPLAVSGRMPTVYIPPDPTRPSVNPYVPVAFGVLLVAAAIGITVAVRGLTAGRKVRLVTGGMAAESERHQVRR